MNRMSAEQTALLSNLPSSAIDVLWELKERGLNIFYVLSTVMQALRSLPTDQILEFAKENWDQKNPRVGKMFTHGNRYPLQAAQVNRTCLYPYFSGVCSRSGAPCHRVIGRPPISYTSRLCGCSATAMSYPQ